MVSFADLSGFIPLLGAVGSHSAASWSQKHYPGELQVGRVDLWKEHENSSNKSPPSVWESNQRPPCWGATAPTNRLPCYQHGLSASHPVLVSGEGGIEDTGRLSRVSFGFVWTTWTSQETHTLTHTHTQSGRNRPAGVCLCVCASCEICRAPHAIPSRFPITTHYTLSTSHLLPKPSLLDSLSLTRTHS